MLLHSLSGDARYTSWYTEGSKQYARIYQTTSDETIRNASTTWNRGQGNQLLPVYVGIHEVCYSDDWVYVRATGLGSHIMGPWYLNEAKTNLFPNYPSNRATLYRLPRNPTVPTTKTLTGFGAQGIFVDGVAMFDSRDAFSYSNANAEDDSPNTDFQGDEVWNRDAYINEGITFDAANAHQAGPQYHYHANPPGLRHLLGDHVDYDEASNRYTENPTNLHHSPILAWANDGYPLYGPYGYSNPTDPDSGVRRMISGFQTRDGTNGTPDLASTGRTTLPAWAATVQDRSATLPSNLYGPAVDSEYILGHYIEDYAYKGDLGMTQGTDFDLDLHNGRFCVTPEFPNGTYAYFVAMLDDGTPTYPYNIGRAFYGDPAGNSVDSINESVTKYFEGGPEVVESPKSVSVDQSSGDLTLVWDGLEGGTYQLEKSTDLKVWAAQPQTLNPTGSELTLVDSAASQNDDVNFYRVRRLGYENFDDAGFDYTPINTDKYINLTVTLSGSEAAPSDLATLPTELTFNGTNAVFVSRPAQDQIEIQADTSALFDGDYTVSATFDGLAAPLTGTYTVTGNGDAGNVVNTGNNILLLIIDDWGVDASPIDNTTQGTTLANMPTLESLRASGIRFTNAYAQPLCSPTRASMLTGRLPFRHGVGNPTSDSTLPTTELTLPEILDAQNSGYAHASFGKWHLGNGTSGPRTAGGWGHFQGIQGGGVDDFYDWPKLEVVNSQVTQTTSVTDYTTTDQVDDAIAWIAGQGDTPWFCWMGFNAAHTPFHEPPAGLEPETGGGYSGGTGNAGKYRRALEALDTEIQRLLANVDMDKTNIILMGDNGTPNQVVQAPFSDGHSKGTLFEGGVKVPMVISGPDVAAVGGSTSAALVNCVDIFSTTLELCGVPVVTGTANVDKIDSQSLVPLLIGVNDTADRAMVVEKFGDTSDNGRALISDDYPDFKLIVYGDREDTQDTPTFTLYNLTDDPDEQAPLDLDALDSTQQTAYDHLLAREAAIGGGYSDPAGPAGVDETFYFTIQDNNDFTVPVLIAAQGPDAGDPLPPFSVTIGEKDATIDTGTLQDGNPASRVDENGDADRYRVKVVFNTIQSGLAPGDHTVLVYFPPENSPRIFTADETFTVP